MNNLIAYQRLHEQLNDPNVAIIDCRFTLGKPDQGLNEYRAGHIPGALYFDLEQDLSGPKQKHGGRHPLPSVDSLVYLFSNAGIDEDVLVVAYDDQEMAMAAHLWWLLRYLGHEKVAVLDGGLNAWKAAGLPITDKIVYRPARRFIPKLQSQMLVEIEQVKNRSKSTALLDSRAGERYRGERETLDPKAGHIPGALHYFYKENLHQDGTMKSPEELKKRFATLSQTSEVIAYCGSGVTACVNLLALYQAGRTDAKLYAGSWSDWCSYDLPIAQS
ncbi:sulfurtransferase [Candidatus Acetothermia bacterium]|nr:sulfurtransferase [Candidatus Acetothermia bacterium]